MFLNNCLFLTLLVTTTVSAEYLYSGKVSSFSESEDHLVTYTHGPIFDPETSKSEMISAMKIYAKRGTSLALLRSKDLEELLTHVEWVSNAELIVGLSVVSEQSDLSIYNLYGDKIAEKNLNCDAYRVNRFPLFCSGGRFPEHRWLTEQLNYFGAEYSNGNVKICFSRDCIEVPLPE